MIKTILITGGTGLIGQQLSKRLDEKGYQVRHLSRTENLAAKYPAYGWDTQAMTMNPKALEGVDGVIHLAGAGIADERWTAKRKEIIEKSRTKTSHLLYNYLAEAESKPTVVVACSAIGYYGNRGNEKLTEESTVGTDFMADICAKWEASEEPIRSLGIRMPTIRVGVVLSTQGGALPELTKTAALKTLAHFGDRYMSWIHIDDIVEAFVVALENESMNDYYNGTAPTPVTSKEMVNALEKAYGSTMLKMPAPAFGVRLALGEMADVVLNSTRVFPTNLEKIEFKYQQPDLVAALQDLFERKV